MIYLSDLNLFFNENINKFNVKQKKFFSLESIFNEKNLANTNFNTNKYNLFNKTPIVNVNVNINLKSLNLNSYQSINFTLSLNFIQGNFF